MPTVTPSTSWQQRRERCTRHVVDKEICPCTCRHGLVHADSDAKLLYLPATAGSSARSASRSAEPVFTVFLHFWHMPTPTRLSFWSTPTLRPSILTCQQSKGTHYATTQQIFPSCVKVLSSLDGFHGLGSDLQVLLLLVPNCFSCVRSSFCPRLTWNPSSLFLLFLHRPTASTASNSQGPSASSDGETAHLYSTSQPFFSHSSPAQHHEQREEKKRDRHDASLTALKAPRTPN